MADGRTEVKYSSAMSWIAVERFEARPAPGGLAVVQELVNTHAVVGGEGDLLVDLATAQPWAVAAVGQWAGIHGLEPPTLTLTPAGLHTIRGLRATVQAMLETAPDDRAAGPFQPDGLLTRATARVATDGEGRVTLLPEGADDQWLVSAIWSEILLAQYDGNWSRLKLCREPGCRSAFYDGSRNGSGVWHNVRTCGNVNNLRNSRARRKCSTSDPS
jgi:predicted RNA-binding Zn ribbon-like protein